MQLKVAYIPEHFSTPLFFAQQEKYFSDNNLDIEFVPVPEGTGKLVKLLNENEVDIAVGLTEGFVADIAKGNDSYKVVGTYVNSPLCWDISSGYDRSDINKPEDLAGKAIGVSRIGSGSYIMSFVLALQLNFSEPFYSGFKTVSNFKNLRDSVNHNLEDKNDNSDAFMWEHFTSKKYHDSKEIKRIGEIYTPWPSWVIAVNSKVLASNKGSIVDFVSCVRKGIHHFKKNPEKAVDFISSNLDYSSEDAHEWLKTVKFNEMLGESELDWESIVVKTAATLKKAGVLTDDNNTVNSRLDSGIVKLLQ